MLSDRPYMQDGARRAPLSVTVRLIIALVVVFAAVQINFVYVRSPLIAYLPLSLDAITRGFVWQLITFQFLHVGLWHLACNALGLWCCGRFVEHVMGPRRFLLFYLGSGVCGGLLHLLLAWSFPAHFGMMPVLGASAGVMALIAMFCLIQPDAVFQILFVLPVRARHLLIAETAIALFFTIVPSQPGIAHAAHLGGILAAVLVFRARLHDEITPLPGTYLLQRLKALFYRPTIARIPPRSRPARTSADEHQPGPPADADYISREVDPILDKIAQHGIHSLTARERQILDAAKDRMDRR